MPRRFILLTSCIAVMLACAIPASTQGRDPATVVPADFAGFIAIDTTDQNAALNVLGLGAFVASILQPTRIELTSIEGFSTFFPLDALDLEQADFNSLFGSWLGESIVIAYPELSDTYASEQPLAIFSTRDAFRAAADLSPVLQGQDFLQTTYAGGATIYTGDRITFAITPAAVLMGSADDIARGLDVLTGEALSLAENDTYMAVRTQLPENAAVSAFVQGDAAANALSFVLNQGAAHSLLVALGGALEQADVHGSAGTVLRGQVDAAGVTLTIGAPLDNVLIADVALHLTETGDVETPAAPAALMDFVPRSAMIIRTGSDAQTAARFALNSLPLADFAGVVLSAFPISVPSAVATGLIAAPTAADIRAVVGDFEDALIAAGTDLDDRVLSHLGGAYVAALIPRPNRPLPVLNTTFDLLLIVESDDAPALLDGIAEIFEQLTGEALAVQESDAADVRVYVDPATNATLVQAAAQNNLFFVGTGDAVSEALRAGEGDNRLIDQARWTRLAAERPVPAWYFDVNAIYNLVAPSAGGQGTVPVPQVVITELAPENDILHLQLTAFVAG